MSTYTALCLSGTTTAVYQKVPVIKSSTLLGILLTETDLGFPMGVPVIGSVLYQKQ